MTHIDITNALRQEPFRPFEIVLNNGDRYPVEHPEFLTIGVSSLYWFPVIEADGVLVADHGYAVLSIRNVAALKPIAEKAA
ncbi:MAG: hypothetical protein AAF823_15555 [Planctomycetota bacterium]